LQCLHTKGRFDMERLQRYSLDAFDSLVADDNGCLVRYEDVAPYIKEGVQTQPTNNARDEILLCDTHCSRCVNGYVICKLEFGICSGQRKTSPVA